MFFWNSLAFLMIQQMLAIWSLVPQPFLNPAWTSGSSWFSYVWSLAWRILSITLLACEMSVVVWAFFGIAFLWDWNENWHFQVLWPLLSFPNFLHIESSTFTASFFRIWSHSTGIPSPPLTLLIGMLPKAHLTLHSRMSGYRLVTTPSWLSRSWRSFLYSSVYSHYLFLMSSAFVRSIQFLPFIVPIFASDVPLVSLIFLKRSVDFPILLFSSTFLHWSLVKAFLSLLAILWNSVFRWIYLSFSPLLLASLLYSAICKTSSDNHFAFFHFFFLGIVLITASCTMSWTSVHSYLGTLSDLIPWIYFSFPLYIHKGFDLGQTWMV